MAVAVAMVTALAIPSGASAFTNVPSLPVLVNEGPAPADVKDKFADCPPLEAFKKSPLCLTLVARDGELKLGKTVAQVTDPIKVTVGIDLDAAAKTADLIYPEGGGAPKSVKISGGLLGIPALDPLLDADPLGLLSVSATPQLAEPLIGREDQDPAKATEEFFYYVAGLDGDQSPPQTLRLPLTIKLNNLLFGKDCAIDEFEIDLTNGTTVTPEGVAPLEGADAAHQNVNWTPNFPSEDGFQTADVRIGSKYVDNGFAVPDAEGCDTLNGLGFDGSPLESLLNADSLINTQVGLPSPAGNNHAKFTVDTYFGGYDLGSGGGGFPK